MRGQGNWNPIDATLEDYNSAESQATRVFASAALASDVQRRQRERTDRRIDSALQIAIAILTMAALWLLTSNSPDARWGHVVGLVSQPFYIVASWRARQWGMLFVAVMLLGVWGRGIVNNFF